MPLPWSLEWCGDHLKLHDQRRLPQEVQQLLLRDWRNVDRAIGTMAVRGAPVIGVAAAWGVVLAANSGENPEQAIRSLRQARPTAVNLRWALDRMQPAINGGGGQDPTIFESMASSRRSKPMNVFCPKGFWSME